MHAPAARSAPEGVGAVAASAAGSRFTVRIPEPRLDAVAGTPYSRLDLDGFNPSTAPGTPLLPARIVHVAVPPMGTVSVRATAIGTRTLEGVRLAPTPEYIERGAPVVESLIPRRSAYARRAGSPSPARLLGVSWLRNQRVASIVIEPAQWDPATLRLEVAAEVAIEVIGEPQAPTEAAAETEDSFEGTYRDLLVNYEQGRAWRRAAVTPEDRNRGRDFEPQSVAAIVDSSVFEAS